MHFSTPEELIAACKEYTVRVVASSCTIVMEKVNGTWVAAGMSIGSSQVVENIPSTPSEEAEYGK